jgi:hypothetical protein
MFEDCMKVFGNQGGGRTLESKELVGLGMNCGFTGESAVDCGGVTKEFFHLAVAAFTSPERGFFRYSDVDQITYQIDPASGSLDDVEMVFRVLGRIVGKAMKENCTVNLHFTRAVYRHMLKQAVTMDDLEMIETDTYNSLKWMKENVVTEDMAFFMTAPDFDGVIQTSGAAAAVVSTPSTPKQATLTLNRSGVSMSDPLGICLVATDVGLLVKDLNEDSLFFGVLKYGDVIECVNGVSAQDDGGSDACVELKTSEFLELKLAPPNVAAAAAAAVTEEFGGPNKCGNGLALCQRGCGRPAFGGFETCCVKCTGVSGQHNYDCETKALAAVAQAEHKLKTEFAEWEELTGDSDFEKFKFYRENTQNFPAAIQCKFDADEDPDSITTLEYRFACSNGSSSTPLEVMDLYSDVHDVQTIVAHDPKISLQRSISWKEVELIPGGTSIAVTDQNKAEFIRLKTARVSYGRISRQVDAFMTGVHEVIPPSYLNQFSAQELELVLAGMSDIDMADWKANTRTWENSTTIAWWWQIVEAMSEEMKAKILQFATGTSRVPAGGFSQLQERGGDVHKFTLNIVDLQFPGQMPHGHTCFNTLDLPRYTSKSEMETAINVALEHGAVGFAESGWN